MRPLSKSKLIAFRQCPRRLWLEVHHPNLREDSPATEAVFQMGYEVGEIARTLYDPKGRGVLIDVKPDDLDEAMAQTQIQLARRKPLFEAGFRAAGGQAFADVVLPIRGGGWRMVEVKASTEVKPYHREDAAIQAYIARQAGLDLTAIALAHVDNSFVYPGGGDYKGLLVEEDLSEEAFGRADEVQEWIESAQIIVAKKKLPRQTMGTQCSDPYPCGFANYCQSLVPQAEFPVTWLPNIQKKKLKEHLATGVSEMRDVPDALLNEQQLRVKRCTLKNKVYFAAEAAKHDLANLGWPAYFLDFETTIMVVPIWEGTRPYQQIPFQFSLHKLTQSGTLTHTGHLDLSGQDPRRKFAETLVKVCGKRGPVFVYNQGFEATQIKALAQDFPDLEAALLALNDRLVDMLKTARQHYYHPSQQGSWSIKALLPAIAPKLRYDDLEGVKNGGMAMEAYRIAVHPETTQTEKARIHDELETYCKLDTYAMVKVWQHFSGNKGLEV